MNRVVATLALLMALLFAGVTFSQSEFLLLHIYEGAIYVVIVVLLSFGREEWAYPLGLIVPLVWIVLNFLTGQLGAGAVQLGMLIGRGEVTNITSLLAAAITAVGLALAAASLYYYRKEIHGSPTQGAHNFVLGAIISLAFYTVLVLWFTAAIREA